MSIRKEGRFASFFQNTNDFKTLEQLFCIENVICKTGRFFTFAKFEKENVGPICHWRGNERDVDFSFRPGNPPLQPPDQPIAPTFFSNLYEMSIRLTREQKIPPPPTTISPGARTCNSNLKKKKPKKYFSDFSSLFLSSDFPPFVATRTLSKVASFQIKSRQKFQWLSIDAVKNSKWRIFFSPPSYLRMEKVLRPKGCRKNQMEKKSAPWQNTAWNCATSRNVIQQDTFLAIFRNEITTILTPSTSEKGEWGRRGGHFFRFGGPWLQIRNVNILIYLYTKVNPE